MAKGRTKYVIPKPLLEELLKLKKRHESVVGVETMDELKFRQGVVFAVDRILTMIKSE